MRKLQRALERFSHWVETVAGLMMGAITLLVVVSAVTRYLFAWPLPDAFDLSRYLLGAAIMWGFACVGFRGSHIKVDLLAEALPAPIRRWVDAFAWAVLLFFTVLLAWKLLGRVTSAAGSGEATMDLRLPAWPLMALIWAGVAVAILTITARLLIILFGNGSLDAFDSAEEHAE
ncbi:TRAP transporter small permease [Oceanicola sp. 502str15]|uniref:TRAP transporter small permease n=1 Tax=Oceanicola sp. 502str15 TaxID=2696061 RepID=UPI002094FFD5|nr:TRAP transporter small permease [Oceanicola sp. 502str15]MCO6381204.1 TRAP transporter small permease subunit [Oceanicola sp. 502str15]